VSRFVKVKGKVSPFDPTCANTGKTAGNGVWCQKLGDSIASKLGKHVGGVADPNRKETTALRPILEHLRDAFRDLALPVGTHQHTVLNLQTAKRLSLDIPPTLLTLASVLIDKSFTFSRP
jgi:hypothetical protein